MSKIKIKIFALLSLIIAFSLVLSSCDSLWDDLGSITISFDSNGGEGTMKPQSFVATVPQALRENTFTKEGYIFAGWATKADASKAEYSDKAKFTATKNITLYAIWVEKFTITYVSDHGTVPEAKKVEPGYKLTADDLITLTETGYNFKGWDKSVGDEITADTTITATWGKTWTITYASNKSELNGKLPSSKTVDEGYKLTSADLSTLTADGYNFKGWDKSVGDTITADTTITANWAKNCKLTYSSAYGTKPANKEVEEGYQLTAEDLPDLGETGDNYFDKWNKTVGTEITADTTITAAWETIVYFDKSTITSYKSTAEKIIFTSDTYNGTDTSFDCASGSNPEYFKGVLDGTTLTIYGNGRRIYAPENSSQLFSGFSKVTNIEFNNFYTSKVTDMQQMFYNCKLLASLDLSSFDTSAVTNMMAMFSNCEALTSPDLSSFNTSSVTNMSAMFMGCKAFTSLDLSLFDTSNVTTMQSMFQTCTNLSSLNISSFTTSAVTTMRSMFYNCNAVKSLDVSKFDTSNVTDMYQMFSTCKELTSLDLSSFDTSKVTNMQSMFYNCNALTELNISKFDTSSVTTMESMFYKCNALTELDISKFNTSNVTSMSQMFFGCTSLTTLDLSHFDTSKVTNIGNMFNSCSMLSSLNVSNFDTSKITGFAGMFADCTSLTTLDLSSFDTTAAHAIGVTMCWGMFTNDGTETNPLIIKVGSKWDITDLSEIQYLGGNIQLDGI